LKSIDRNGILVLLPALERYCYDRGYTVKGVYIEQESAWKAGHQK